MPDRNRCRNVPADIRSVYIRFYYIHISITIVFFSLRQLHTRKKKHPTKNLSQSNMPKTYTILVQTNSIPPLLDPNGLLKSEWDFPAVACVSIDPLNVVKYFSINCFIAWDKLYVFLMGRCEGACLTGSCGWRAYTQHTYSSALMLLVIINDTNLYDYIVLEIANLPIHQIFYHTR